MGNIIFNDKVLSSDEIKIDVEDRGYQFGDGVYEVIRIYNGKLFASKPHLNRLFESAEAIELNVPFTLEEIENRLIELIKKDQLTFGTVYLQLTRGVAKRNHAFPTEAISPTFLAYTSEKPYEGERKQGIKAILTEDIRWLRCNIKSLNLLGNILAKQKAVNAQCMEAFQHRDGIITEGSSSNIMLVKDGMIQTHPANHLILNGITRQVVKQICKAEGIPFIEDPFTVEDLFAADEIFYTSTSVEVTPVIELDGKTIGSGQIGPMTHRLQALFRAEIEKQCGRLVD